MPAPLEMFLRAITSGQGNTFSPEMLDHFGGGSDILAQLQKYDPNAHFSDVDMGGGEGGSQGMGKRLDFDVSMLPKSKKGTAGLDLNPGNLREAIPGTKSIQDDVYGDVRNSTEMYNKQGKLDKALPYLAMIISMGGPALAAALAGAGIGGAAGLTAGVTGSGVSGAAPSWLSGLVKQGPGLMDKTQAPGGFNIMSLLPALASAGGGAMGIDPMYTKGGLTLAQLARGGR